MKPIIKTTITKVETYRLSKDITYVRTLVNGEKSSDHLNYTSGKINGWPVQPIYNPDLSMLAIWNPYWAENKELKIDGYKWFDTELPEPEEVLANLDKIVLCQSSTHCFLDLDKQYSPVVVHGEYIEARINNSMYHLKELREYLLTHPNVVRCSDTLDVPYYNAGDSCGTKYLDVFALPTKEFINSEEGNKSSRFNVFYKPHQKVDFLGMSRFVKKDYIKD